MYLEILILLSRFGPIQQKRNCLNTQQAEVNFLASIKRIICVIGFLKKANKRFFSPNFRIDRINHLSFLELL